MFIRGLFGVLKEIWRTVTALLPKKRELLVVIVELPMDELEIRQLRRDGYQTGTFNIPRKLNSLK
jgi:hypothetical protein